MFPKPSASEDAGLTSAPGKFSFGRYLRLAAIWLTLVRHVWILLAILAVAGFVRARDPHYSSAFMDESIYVLYGRMFLSGRFEAPLDQPLGYSFGWYLWPALAAAADRIAGLAGVRELAALLGVVTVLAVYGFARRLFSPAVGLASATVFALLGPAVLASRIATRDAGTICFLALGLWLYVRAWQEDERGAWLASVLCFFAAFLCKYLVALYFPFLALLNLRRGRRAALFFALCLSLVCAAYGIRHVGDLAALLRYGHAYGALKAPANEAWQIYFTRRLDFWVLLVLSLAAWTSSRGAPRYVRILLWIGVAVLPLFQFFSRADYDYWKHINYSLLFLTPLAMEGLLRLVRAWTGGLTPLAGSGAVGLLAVLLGWSGYAWRADRFVFWPNVEPIAAFFDGRLTAEDRVLIDDTALRYYFHPTLRQWKMTDPFFFRYQDAFGEPAYAAAVRDAYFDYIALDGGMGDDARRMRAAIQPSLSGRYVLKLRMPEPNLGQEIEIYERAEPPPAAPASPGPQLEILSPLGRTVVQTTGKSTTLQGVVKGAEPGGYVLADVFTNRWYPQGGKIFAGPDGSFSARIYLAGERAQQCYHIVRARLFDPRGRRAAVALQFGIARANEDGRAPSCP